MSSSTLSAIRQNYHEACEAAINRQINVELNASYVYLAMAYHFDRDDVALKGFYNLFKRSSDEEREHAQKFMHYQNKRGGRIILNDIKTPERGQWTSGLDAMSMALQLELKVNEHLLELHRIATEAKDSHLTDYLESEFLQEQVESIKMLGDHVTNLKRVGTGLGEYQFDNLTLQEEEEDEKEGGSENKN